MPLQSSLLRPWQREPAQHLLRLLQSGQNCVDCSDTGTGKSYGAMAVAAALRLPTLVCAPKISKTQWIQVAEHFGDTLSVVGHEQLRTRSPFGKWQYPPPANHDEREYYMCVICQCKINLDDCFPCPYHAAGLHCIQTKKKPHRYGRFIFSDAVKFLIVDEIHKFNGLDSLNADILIAARRQNIPTLGLSATLGSSPLHFRALGYLLGLHGLNNDTIVRQRCGIGSKSCGTQIFPSFGRWAGKYGVRRDPTFRGLHWPVSEEKQKEAMRDIRASIIPSRGVRVSADDIPGFPEVDISAKLYDLATEGEAKIDEIYSEMAESLRNLDDRMKLDVAPESAITIQLRAQQRIELFKVPLAVEIAKDRLEQGFSVGVFVGFTATIAELAKRLDTDAIIDGSPKGVKNRQRHIDAFQANTSQLILVNSAAGGVALSLQDLHGGHPRFGAVFPGFSVTILKQLLGRFRRDGGKSRSMYQIILAAKTVETKIYSALRGKLNNLDSLNSGDLLPNNLIFSKE